MKVYKCDRCKQVYEKEITSRRYIEIIHDLYPKNDYILKLCDNCHKELLDWLVPYINTQEDSE